MKYELTFLLQDEAETKTIKDLFTLLSVKLVKEDTWGKKTLAYPIAKSRSALFFHWIIETDKKKVLELKKRLNYNEKLVRYLLLAIEEK